MNMEVPPTQSEGRSGLDVAIVGMAGRFPGASNLDEFWENLKNGVESITFFSDDEVIYSGVDPDMASDPDFVPAGGGMDGEYCFDADFFDLSPRDAEITDPQQRVLLECAWAALEEAGYNPETFPGQIGIYAGASINTYLLFSIIPNKALFESVGHFQTMTANDKDFLATRVAYKLNLKGPAISVQTACSTSLVAVNLACQSLLNYQSDMVLAGGVSITPKGRVYKEGFIFSKDGHCRAFDARAQGTVSGNGVGLVVLKRLEDALADGDHIHAVIKGSAINNDGSLKVGYTAPSVGGQTEVILEAQAMAEVEPDTITYIEAHGTGTLLGDPIEIAALTQAFRTRTDREGYCAIGSVKTNIGHLDAAAGISGLLKAVLAIEHGQIPPSLHFKQANPKLGLEKSPFFVSTELSDWRPSGMPRRAGVSSFGFGGTNAHVILEEAPSGAQGTPARPRQLLVLSARTEPALQQAIQNLVGLLDAPPAAGVDMADVAYTLQVGRKAFEHRAYAVVEDAADAADLLRSADPKLLHIGQAADRPSHDVAFMFSGQGSQYIDMGRELFEHEPVFRETMRECAALMQPHLGHDLLSIIYPNSTARTRAEKLLAQTLITQPALFAIEYSLARQWQAWGISPSAMIGHSVGEYVAACLAGVFTLEDAAKIICARAKLIQDQAPGVMLSVPLPEGELTPILPPGVSVAVVNTPQMTVVSGPESAVAALERGLSERGVEGRRLLVSHAFHSDMMEAAAEQFKSVMAQVALQAPRVRFVSNRTGDWITDAEACSPEYWAEHLRHTVRFSEGLQTLLAEAPSAVLEVGPGQVLATLARQHRDAVRDCLVVASTRHPQVETPDSATLLEAVGALWGAGVDIKWSAFHDGEVRRRVPLPTYPFQSQLFYLPPVYTSGGKQVPLTIPPVLKANEAAGSYSPEVSAVSQASYRAPADETEEAIAQIWQKMLGIERVSTADDFFILGGHSLMATQLIAEVRRVTHTDVSVQALFEEPTIAGLAKRVRLLKDTQGAVDGEEIAVIPRDDYLPLTFHQETVWAFENMVPGTARFNGFITLALHGPLDTDALGFAMNEILRRHEVLRTTYSTTDDGRPIAVIHPFSPVQLPLEDLSDVPPDEREREALSRANALARRSFNIGEDLMMRPVLLRLSQQEHLLLIASHYIAVDGWTIGLVIQELGEHYGARIGARPTRLSELPFQCVDYASWQREQVTEAVLAAHLPYWREQLLDAPSQEPVPLDRPRPSAPSLRGAAYHFTLGPDLTEAVKDFSHRHGSTTFMTLVSALNALFNIYSGQKDIVIGTITGDREIGMEALVGAFVNILALRNHVESTESFLTLLDGVRKVATDAYAHQIPFMKLAQDFAGQRDIERDPVFRVMFILRNIPMTQTAADSLDISLSPLPIDRGVADQDVSLYLQEKGGAFGGYFEYSTDLFDRETIEGLAAKFVALLHHVVERPASPLSQLETVMATAVGDSDTEADVAETLTA